MGLDIGVLALILIGVLAAVLLFLDDRRTMKMEAVRMEKMRNSNLYMELHEIVKRCRKRYVEQVHIRRECVVFTMMLPVGRQVIYSFEGRGYRPLTKERLHTLCLLLGEDLPVLWDKNRYRLRKVVKTLPNGERAVEYVYTMKTVYKDALNRAPYYM